MSAITVHRIPVNAVRSASTGEPITAAQGFAAWLEQNEPALFAALAEHAAAAGTRLGDWSSILSDVGSFASSVGSDISGAASSVGTYLTSSQGMQSLASLANTYLQSQTAQQVVSAQLARANQGMAPAPITYQTNAAGQVVPVYTGANPPAGAVPVQLGNGQVGYQLGSGQLAALSSGGIGQFFQQYGTTIAVVGGILLVGVLALGRRR